MRAVGVTPKAELARHAPDGRDAGHAHAPRPCFFDDRRPSRRRSTTAHDLPAGFAFEGPAIVEQLDSTIVVPPGWRAEVDEWLNIRMHDPEAAR